MESVRPKRQALEDLWRHRHQIALSQYRRAKATTIAVQVAHRDSLTSAPDGTFAVGQALNAENAALREYCRVLAIFTDLVVYGKTPPDEPK